MIIFVGSYRYSVDAQGRMQIPSKFLSKLADNKTLFLLPSFSEKQAIEVYPESIWYELFKEVEAEVSFPQKDEFLLYLSASSEEVMIDTQGRITIPQRFREACQITKEVMIIGKGKKFALFNPQLWQQIEQRLLQKVPTETINALPEGVKKRI